MGSALSQLEEYYGAMTWRLCHLRPGGVRNLPSAVERVPEDSRGLPERNPWLPSNVPGGECGKQCRCEIGTRTGLYRFQTSVQISDSRSATRSDMDPVFPRLRQLAPALHQWSRTDGERN